MQIERRKLFESELVHVAHARARPVPGLRAELERQSANVLVLPLAGVFAKHDGPRRQVLATPSHALFIPVDTSYRISLPGDVGDACLTLRFSAASLARLVPGVMAGDGFDTALFEAHTLLPAELMLTRSFLWRSLVSGEWDALEAEELAIGLLVSALHVARRDRRGGERALARSHSRSMKRQVGRVMEAIAVAPERRWTLGSLAELVGISPWHLAHGFRAETGLSLYQFVLRSRLATTLAPVLDTNAELASIALDAGFASHSHFTARFRALFGRTPRALRRDASTRAVAGLRKIVTARP